LVSQVTVEPVTVEPVTVEPVTVEPSNRRTGGRPELVKSQKKLTALGPEVGGVVTRP